MSEILICGGSGLIGSKLINKLKQKNHKYVLLSTQEHLNNGRDIYHWNPEKGIFPVLDLKRFSACINLCGAGIFDRRIGNSRRKVLLDSRVIPLDFLKKQFLAQGVTLPHLISASATGYYPNECLTVLNEDSTPGNEWIASLVEDWERAAISWDKTAGRISIVRTGIVLAREGGFLKKLAGPVLMGVGAVPGSGRQSVSWIHIDDLCDLYLFLLEKGLPGIYNATAPCPESLGRITRLTASRLHRPLWLPPIPYFALMIVFGAKRAGLLITDQKVLPERIMEKGFQFRYNTIESALEDLLP